MPVFLKLFIIAFSYFRLTVALSNDRYYPRYHLAPIQGWMNDPNGFCVFNNEYHLFYQYNPNSSVQPGIALWGHAKSKDLFNWVNLGVAMDNNTAYDKDGVFSGSAVVESGVMYLFYTAHVNLPGLTPDHHETQALASSTDGVRFTKYANNPIISGEDLQPDIRDPKVWKRGNDWYMVLGNSFIGDDNARHGRVVLFHSKDRVHWKQASILLESDGSLGYMWECPDFFEIDGRFVLLFSPQGIQPQGDRFKNLFQTGYIVGNFDYIDRVFTPQTEFRELDFGHDFYATQTILDNRGRRLLVAWMDMWPRNYPSVTPAALDGFTGQMTIIRTLSLTKDNRLIQKPVKEVNSVRGKALFIGNSLGGTRVTLSNKAGEVYLAAPRKQDVTLYIGTNSSAVEIKYEFLKGRVSLKRDDGEDGLRRTIYRPMTRLMMRVFIDASSIEVFFGEGEVTISSRYYIDGAISVWLSDNSKADLFSVYEMKSTLYQNKK